MPKLTELMIARAALLHTLADVCDMTDDLAKLIVARAWSFDKREQIETLVPTLWRPRFRGWEKSIASVPRAVV